MSDWWAGCTLDSLDGVRVNVFEQGRRYGGCPHRVLPRCAGGQPGGQLCGPGTFAGTGLYR